MGWLKCIVDVAFNVANISISLRFCVRNSHGNFLNAQAMSNEEHMSILEGEAKALLEAIKFIISKGVAQCCL